MSFWHCRGEIFAHTSLQNCFSAATLESYRGWIALFRCCHCLSMGFSSRLQNFHFLPFEPFTGGLSLMLGIAVLPHYPVVLVLQVIDWWPDILLQEFLLENRIRVSLNYDKPPWPQSSKASHYTATSMLDSTYSVLLWKSVLGLLQI